MLSFCINNNFLKITRKTLVRNFSLLPLNGLSIIPDKIAISDRSGDHTYSDLNRASLELANKIKNLNVNGERICLLCPNSSDYAKGTFGIWLSGNVSVPLCKGHPVQTLDYYVKDAKAPLIVYSPEYQDQVIK